MNKEAIQRLREPAAWVLVGAALASVVGGLSGLLFGTQRVSGVDVTFSVNAALVREAFIGLPITALSVLGVLLATQVGERVPRARVLVMTALGVQGGAALFGLICWLAGLASPLLALGAKLQGLLTGAGELAVLAVAGYFTFIVFGGLPKPPRPVAQPQPQGQPGQAYQGYPYHQQQGAPMGHQGYPPYHGYPPGQQPGQPGQPGQPYGPGGPGQQYGQAPPPGPGEEYGQPPHTGPSSAGPSTAPQDLGTPVAGNPQYGPTGSLEGEIFGMSGPKPDPDAEDAGQWTHAYGGPAQDLGGDRPGSDPAPGGGYPGPDGSPSYPVHGQDSEGRRQPPEAPGVDWYRDSR